MQIRSGSARPDHAKPFRAFLIAAGLFSAAVLVGPSPAQTHSTIAPASSAGTGSLTFLGELNRERGGFPAAFPGPADTAPFAPTFGRLPLYFIENGGQLDSRVSHHIHGRDKAIYFASDGISIALLGSDAPAGRWTVKLDFEGANAAARAIGHARRPARVSYFKGSKAERITGLATYGALMYQDLWPGIDLEYTGEVNRLKYTLLVGPGADPSRIQFRYRGADVRLTQNGEIEVATPFGNFRDSRPFAYQEVAGKRVAVAVQFALESDGTLGFELGTHDASRPLVIDPSIVLYAGFVGGGAMDGAAAIAVDAAGNAYVAGETASPAASFPEAAGPDLTFNGGDRDAFVAKVSPDGTTLLYAGYLGGAGNDFATGIAVDGAGNTYVTGETSSNENSFPVAGGPDLSYNGGRDAFVAKINASGTALVYSGYVGGSNIDTGRGIAVDASGNAYLTGDTFSSEATFPARLGPDLTFNGVRDAFVAKVAANGAGLVYAGYVGGDRADIGRAISVGADGSAYIAGDTASAEGSFPVRSGPDLTYNGGPNDAFVAKITPSGTALEFAGYIGGNQTDIAHAIAVSAAGVVFVAGETASELATFPVLRGPGLAYGGGVRDGFAASVNSSGTSLIYSGYIGGTGTDIASSVALDADGNLYVAGSTGSAEDSFPVAVGPDLTFNGVRDAFAAKVNPSGSGLLFAGYFGGAGDDAGNGIALGPTGDIYLAGTTSSTEASFPVVSGPDLTANGATDAFVARFTVDEARITREGIVNAASYVGGAIAPGEIISIFGIMIGPEEPVLAELDENGRLATQIGGTRVLFDGVPGAMFYAGEGQLNVQVPYSVAGASSVEVKVIHNGQETNAVRVDVAASAPGLFTADASGSGQVIAVDVNGNLNSAEHPVGPDDVIVLYATGEGQTEPRGITGKLAEPPYPQPVLPVRLLIGGIEAQLLYAGAAPGFAGLMQINAIVPAGLFGAALSEGGHPVARQSPDGVPVVLTIGDGESQPGAWLNIGDGGSGVGIPTANPQSLTTDEDTPLNITLTGSDPEREALAFAILGGPSNGELVLGAATATSRAATYTPQANYNGPDSFVFQVTDPANNKAMAVVSITVIPVNDPPVAVDDTASTLNDRSATINVLANDSDPDGDPLHVSAVGNPPNGAAVIEAGAQRIVYTPNGSFTGVDSFPYTVSDGLLSATAMVRVTVREQRDERADLRITKTPASAAVTAGGQVTYTLTVSNLGPAGATGVTVTDTFPPSLTHVSNTCGGIAGAGTLSWSIGSLSEGGVVACQVTFNVSPAASGNIINRASVSGSEPDSDTVNNSVLTSNPVQSDVTLSVTKALVGPFRQGMTADYLVTVNHVAGVSLANNVQVTDILDSRLSFVSAGSSAGCSAVGQTVTCNAAAPLAPGGNVAFTIRVLVGGTP